MESTWVRLNKFQMLTEIYLFDLGIVGLFYKDRNNYHETDSVVGER